eukprot:m.282785 g.282785  ORF g.282785 m.282785 type:complete len:284 (+) comp22900_c8_seq6:5520-6371(+)
MSMPMARSESVRQPRMRRSASGSKVLVSSRGGLRTLPRGEKLTPLHLEEPEWVPDAEAVECALCKGGFSFLNRKHHCRRCGQVSCGRCCKRHLFVHRMCYTDPVRVCETCKTVVETENEFFEKYLKALKKGLSVFVRSSGGLNQPVTIRIIDDCAKIQLVDKGDTLLDEFSVQSVVYAEKMSYNDPNAPKETTVFELKEGERYECAGDKAHVRALRKTMESLIQFFNAHHVRAQSMSKARPASAAPHQHAPHGDASAISSTQQGSSGNAGVSSRPPLADSTEP